MTTRTPGPGPSPRNVVPSTGVEAERSSLRTLVVPGMPVTPGRDGRGPFWTVEVEGEDGPERVRVVEPDLAGWFADLTHPDEATLHLISKGGAPVVERVTLVRHVPRSVSAGPDGDVAPPPGLHDLHATLEATRAHLESGGWRDLCGKVGVAVPPPGTPASSWMCRMSSAILLRVVSERHAGGAWHVEGGHPTVLHRGNGRREFKPAHARVDGGMWDRVERRWCPHYWLAGSHDGRDVILDVTADQFGWEPVVVADGADTRYRASFLPRVAAAHVDGSLSDRTSTPHVESIRDRLAGIDAPDAWAALKV